MFFKIFLIMMLLQPETVIIDKIAAVVNDDIITMSDIDKAILMFPVFRKRDESSASFYNRVLNDLINYKVITMEYRNDFQLGEEDFVEVQSSIIKKVGSLGKLYSLLRSFDMEWKDFKDFIREKVIYELVVRDKFQIKIVVMFKEIEEFYTDDYLPSQKMLGLEPRSLVEMAPLIEKHIRKNRTEERFYSWLEEIKSSYKIDNLLLRGE